MTIDIANEVASMQDQIETLSIRNHALEGELSIVRSELAALRVQYSMLKVDRDKHMVKATRVYTLLQQVGITITGGINAMNEDARREQETALGVNHNDTARFIRKEVTKHSMRSTIEERRTQHGASSSRLPAVNVREGMDEDTNYAGGDDPREKESEHDALLRGLENEVRGLGR